MCKQTRNIQLFSLLFVSVFAISIASPIKKLHHHDNYHSPKWWNACRWLTSDRSFMGLFLNPMGDLLHNIIKSAKINENQAQYIKQLFFVEDTFSDPIFLNSFKEYEWLPVIPDSKEQVFQKITFEDAITTSYEYMQYFAVGIEQILDDQQIYEGSMIIQFKEIEYELNQLLCNLQTIIHILSIQQKPNVSRNVMSPEYRYMKEQSRRNLRDYTIIRHYINATHFVTNLFAYLKTDFNTWESTD